MATGQINPVTADRHYADPSLLGKGTNWQDAIFQTAFQHSHQISAQGGSEKVQYYVSANYMDQEGTIIGSEFDRLGMRVNLDAKLKPWLKMGLSTNFSTTHDNLKLADNDQGIINYSLTTPPEIPIYDMDGGNSSVSKEGFTNPNPIAMAMLNQIRLDRRKLNGNLFFEVTPVKNLVWHAELGYDLSADRGRSFLPTVDLGSWKRSAYYGLNTLYKNYYESKAWNVDPSTMHYATETQAPNVSEQSFTLPFPSQDIVFNGNLQKGSVHVDVRSTYAY